MDYTLEELETEFEVFKKLLLNKLNAGELDEGCLTRVIDHIYFIGIYQGRKEMDGREQIRTANHQVSNRHAG
jgi:hypothetical protein